jgi:hypothetical protein
MSFCQQDIPLVVKSLRPLDDRARDEEAPPDRVRRGPLDQRCVSAA